MNSGLSVKEVARQAGVSASTVSLVFRGSGLVAAGTRERVLGVARDIGYRPHSGARATRGSRHNAVGVIAVRPFSDETTTITPFPPGLIDGLNDNLVDRDICLSFLRISRLPEMDQSRWPRLLSESRADGFIVTSVVPPELKGYIDHFKLPAVWVNNNFRDKFDCITYDEIGAGRNLTRYLLEKGHRRIAFLRGSNDLHYSEADRFAGYVEEMEAWNLDYHKGREAFIPENELEEHVKKLLLPLPGGPDRPTAIICVNHIQAQKLARITYSLELRVPKDLSVAAWGPDISTMKNMAPSHTAMITDDYQVGQLAVDLLMEKISHGGQAGPSKVLQLQLYEGESVGSPREQ
jgi:LacI family transcriptional regulator